MTGSIAFQGLPGAYSDLACRTAYPALATLPCATFEAAIEAVREGRATLAMLACENSLAGRVPDVHYLLPDSGLFVIGEHFQRVEHCLLAPRGTALADVRRVHSHAVALGQVRRLLRDLDVQPVIEADTAGAAQLVAAMEPAGGRGDRLRPGGRDLRAGDPARQCRGRRPQHHALLHHGRRRPDPRRRTRRA